MDSSFSLKDVLGWNLDSLGDILAGNIGSQNWNWIHSGNLLLFDNLAGIWTHSGNLRPETFSLDPLCSNEGTLRTLSLLLGGHGRRTHFYSPQSHKFKIRDKTEDQIRRSKDGQRIQVVAPKTDRGSDST